MARFRILLVPALVMAAHSSLAADGKPIRRDEPIDMLDERYVLLPTTESLTGQSVTARHTDELFTRDVGYEGARFIGGASVDLSAIGSFAPDRGVLLRVDWRRATPPFVSRQPLHRSPMGDVYCAWGRTDDGRRMLCFRDEDHDGAFEAVSEGKQVIWPRVGALAFQSIAPVAYTAATAVGPDDPRIRQRLSVYTYDLGDRLRIGLLLYVRPPFSGTGRGLAEGVVVERTTLPAPIEVHGLKLTVLAFDRKTATLRLDQPMPGGPMTLKPNDPADLSKGFRIIDRPSADAAGSPRD